MRVLNTTSQNRSKQARLHSQRTLPRHHADGPEVLSFLQSLDNLGLPKEQLLFSIGIELLGDNQNVAVREFLRECSLDPAPVPGVPRGAFDLLGSAYQYLNTKAENLATGSFYTGPGVAADVLAGLDFSGGQSLLDPSCGSGSFLFRSSASPEQIFGVDVDPIAVMIAKFNYFLKFPDAGTPNIHCQDFFEWFAENRGRRFDYILGNPPFGAHLDLRSIPSQHVTSGESFSYFTELSYQLLKDHGVLRFIVPEALLNVKRHTDIREYLLKHANLRRIKRYPGKFTGVMSDVYQIELDRGQSSYVAWFDGTEVRVPKQVFHQLKNHVFVRWSEQDAEIVAKIEDRRKFDLKQSTFGLGVVTGDNKTRLLATPVPEAERIYTGKEVERFRLLEPRNYIVFDRAKLQQVAPDEIYRAPEKLVYKTICKDLRFALDRTGALTTNSANLLLPQMPGYTPTTVMALLNSPLYSFLHFKMFGGVNKVAKENLMALPFPEIDADQASEIANLVEQIGVPDGDAALQRYIHEELFRLTDDEVAYVNAVLAMI